MISGTTVLNLLASIALLGSMYALVNVGFVLLYRSTGVPNFAQGQVAMFSGFILASAAPFGAGYFTGAIAAIACCALGGLLCYRLLMHRLLGATEFTKTIVTFMLAIVITQTCIMVWATDIRMVPQPTTASIKLGGWTFPLMTLVTVLITVALVVALAWFLDRTLTGIRLQALAENESLSVYAGIPVHRLAGIAWATAFGMAGVAGVLYSQRASIDLSTAEIGLIAFPAAVIGGLNSIEGTLIGALILATMQTVLNYYLGGSYGTIAIYGLMLGTIILRPQGLMGSLAARRL